MTKNQCALYSGEQHTDFGEDCDYTEVERRWEYPFNPRLRYTDAPWTTQTALHMCEWLDKLVTGLIVLWLLIFVYAAVHLLTCNTYILVFENSSYLRIQTTTGHRQLEPYSEGLDLIGWIISSQPDHIDSFLFTISLRCCVNPYKFSESLYLYLLCSVILWVFSLLNPSLLFCV